MKKSMSIILALSIILTTTLCVTALALEPSMKPERDAENYSAPSPISMLQDANATDLISYVETVSESNAVVSAAPLDNVITTITFSNYLTFDEFEKYEKQYSLDSVYIQARGLKPDGTRMTMLTKTYAGLEQTESWLREIASEQDFAFIGITGVNALVSSESLSEIEADARTFLADTSGDLYSTNNSAKSGNIRNSLTSNDIDELFPRTIAWDLEDLGLLTHTAR